MAAVLEKLYHAQVQRNRLLQDRARYLGEELTSSVLPLRLNIQKTEQINAFQIRSIEALQIEAARTAIQAVGQLARIGEFGCLGGGLEVIEALSLSMLVSDDERISYTIEHAHTAIGYYALLASLGYVLGRGNRKV